MSKPARTWMYTINNWTQEDLTKLKALKQLKMHRCCAEIGESGNTPHLQGAITFDRTYRLEQLRKLIKAHWEIALTKDPENYCIKGEILIDIDTRQQGKRTDLEAVAQTIEEHGLVAAGLLHRTAYMKYEKGMKALDSLLRSQKISNWTDVEVIVLWGPPGSGKTRKAVEYDDNYYEVCSPNNGTLWFDGYTGQKTVIFDDFYGWIKWHELLRLLDGYRRMIPTKGGFTHKEWNRVYLTSNKHPNEWYQNIEDRTALMRRINTIEFVDLPKPEESVTEVAVGNNDYCHYDLC